jgi:hypothetical protein
MTTTQIIFDKLVYVDRLKSAGVEESQARAHADALDQALRDTVVTRQDLREEIVRLEHKIKVAVRDLTIRMGGIAILLFGALASIRVFG